MRVVLGLLLVALTAGCLQSEDTEFRVLREGGEPSVFVVEQTNFYSDETESPKVKEDFDRLLKDWLDDAAAKQAAEDGIQLKGRELFIRDGKIVLRQTGIIKDLNLNGNEFQVKGSDIVWTIDGNEEIVETNGKIITIGSRMIVWPKDAKELRVRLHQPLKPAYLMSQPQMMQWLKDYMASHPDR